MSAMKKTPSPYVIGKFLRNRQVVRLEALATDRKHWTFVPELMERFRTRQRAWDIIKQRKLKGRRCVNLDKLLTACPSSAKC